MNQTLPTLQAVILAAGKSHRFNRPTTKLLEKICGRELIRYPITMCEQNNIPITLVVGYQQAEILSVLEKYNHTYAYVIQDEMKGTGDALMCALPTLIADNILVLCGDTPLIAPPMIRELVEKHARTDAAISFVISHSDNTSHHYGRIIENDQGIFIIEFRDATTEQRLSPWMNSGIYIFKRSFLEEYLAHLVPSAHTQEYYVTDLINKATTRGLVVTTLTAPLDAVRGINTVEELYEAEQIKRMEIIKYWMNLGIRFCEPSTTHIDITATLGSGTNVGSNVHIIGPTIIGTNCTIGSFSLIENSICENDVIIDTHSIVRDSYLSSCVVVGPFVHIRNNTHIGHNAMVGNFAEVKNSSIDTGSKAKHLTYLGDATVGKNVNIGAGTVTCNYDGVAKNKTIIKDNAYIGSNNNLVAPITIGSHAYTAAGSTLTTDVPDNALAIARVRQENKEDYAYKIRTRALQKNDESRG